jgi:hypothetical protein
MFCNTKYGYLRMPKRQMVSSAKKNYSVMYIIGIRNVLHQFHEVALQIDGIQFLQHEHISS